MTCHRSNAKFAAGKARAKLVSKWSDCGLLKARAQLELWTDSHSPALGETTRPSAQLVGDKKPIG